MGEELNKVVTEEHIEVRRENVFSVVRHHANIN
jgi:hypothetical protein